MSTEENHPEIEKKLKRLDNILLPMERVLIGYSGGVDSAMLAVAAHRVLGKSAICVTADSESYATGELERAKEITTQFGIPHTVVRTRELDNPDYAKNAPDRCYHCKNELFTHMEQLAKNMDIDYILYGQNADDVKDFRPGSKAANEKGVRAPLAEVGLTKKDVRALAKVWGLSVWDRPAMACLSSRFPYGTKVTSEGLKQVDQAETLLRVDLEFAQVRCRHHSKLARIELPPPDLSSLLKSPNRLQKIQRSFLPIGYQITTLDLRGFRSGSMNEALLKIENNDLTDFTTNFTNILQSHDITNACFEDRGELLYLRFTRDDYSRLSNKNIRDQFVKDCESFGFRYIALDVEPLKL